MKINIIGFPYNSDFNSECLDFVRLWREDGIDVRIIPTAPISTLTTAKLIDLGCTFLFHLIGGDPNKILEARDLRDSVVVGLYSPSFFKVAHHLKSMGCKLIWAGEPLTYKTEKKFYHKWGLCDKYVVKSYFHHSLIMNELEEFRCDLNRIKRIKPPFFSDGYEFNIVPHVPNDLMRVGKVGCASDHNFFPSTGWKIFTDISVPVQAIVTDWSDHLDSITHRPPWVNTVPVYDPKFYMQTHCIAQVANRKDSWLRFALDAMACGSPVVAQNNSGWKEIIRHGENGFLCNSPDEVCMLIDLLAQDENLRVEMAIRARESLFDNLIDNHSSMKSWREIFEGLV